MTKTRPGLLIVDDDELILSLLCEQLADDYDVVGARERSEVTQSLRQLGDPPACALIDLGLPPHCDSPREGFALLRELTASAPSCAVVVVSGQNEEEHGRLARTLGAVDYVAKPCDAIAIREVITRALHTQQTSMAATGLLGSSTQTVSLRRQLRQYAATPHPVLITGESGTGKELAARALHDASSRDGEFIALNCAALPEHLFESNLFGARRGAFTDATSELPGHVAAANGGTLFLDEIGELPLALQPKLLRLLENGEYQRVGDPAPRLADVRIVAATNRPLREQVADGTFRQDLFHRLSVLLVNTKPLRELGEDRELLLDHFRGIAAQQADAPPFEFDEQAAELWRDYSFPGNVRELRNIVTRLQLIRPGIKIGRDDLSAELLGAPPDATTLDALLFADAQAHARAALAAMGSKTAAAKRLGISAKKLNELLRK